MYHPLKTVGLISTLVLTTLISSTAHAATLTLVTKYGDSGGNAGDLNEVGDQVNGNNICPAVNDYSNAVAGCDMSADVAYNDNGTPDNATDDIPEGDLIVRTNDLFNVSVAYGWLGNAGGAEEQVTLTGTLPAGKGFIWEGIPGGCDPATSSLSADEKIITCVRKNFDTNDTGSFAEDMAFPVRVEGDAANGSIPGDISFTVTDPTNSTPVTDGVKDGNPRSLLKITASPRWNIDKHDGVGYYTTSYGVTDDQGNPGWFLWYQFSIEVDEVNGTTDDAPGRLGNEALQGGTDATVTFVDDISDISPNAKLVTWSANGQFSPPTNPCDMDYHTNGDEPYSYFVAAHPDRSIKTPKDTMSVSCTPDANNPKKINVTVDHIDGTLTNTPIKNVNGGLLPVNRAIAAIGVMRIFVPLSDVVDGEDGTSGTGDDGTLTTTNCLTDFDPVGISGGSNFGNATESEVDNCRHISLFASGGSWSKSYRKGWSDQAVERAKWGGGSWALPPTDASIVMSGDGTVTPGSVFGTYNIYNNTGGSTIDNPVVCDVIDVETFDMTVIDPNIDNPGTFLDDTKHAVDLNYGSTETVPGLTIEYATGYVGSWPPNPDEAPHNGEDEVVRECSDPGITWYPDYPTAAANGPVSKVRISAPTLPAGKFMAMRIKHTARSTYLSTKNGHNAGDQILNDALLINHGSYKSALTNDIFRAGYYIPHDANTPHEGGWSGDRLKMVRAKARIIKAMEPAAVSPGSDVTVTLTPSFTTDGPLPETENVTIKDLLPKGLSYTNGSTTGVYGDDNTNFGEPTIISPVTDADCTTHAQDLMDNGQSCGSFGGDDNNTNGGQSLLIWDLGEQITGTVYKNLVFHTIVDVDAPTGTLKNYALIESPADSSVPSKRISNANTNDTVPSSLLIVKSVQTPLHEINSNPLLNWMQFQVGLRNGSSNQLTNLDVIDIIPFNGDGDPASFTFTPQIGTTVNRTRVPATSYNGTFELDNVALDSNGGQCTGVPTYWFTNSTDTLDVSALHPSNAIPNGSANWCGGETSVAASIANCGFAKSEITAVRVRGTDMISSGTCFVNLTYATSGNLAGDIYSNTAGARAVGVTSAVLSNTVSARVYASSIGDKVWLDVNANGIQDVNEAGVPGVVVKLLDSNGNPVKDRANPTEDYQVITDANGNYIFENLVADDYQVKFELGDAALTNQGAGNDSALDSDANPATGIAMVTLGDNEDRTDIDAGVTSLGSMGNVVWRDLDHDGIQDQGEPAASGILVTLLNGNGAPILDDNQNPITTTTDNNGSYLFDKLIPGDYAVGFSNLPIGYQMTLQNQGDAANDSNASTVAIDGMFKTAPITLGLAEENLTLDAGIFLPGSIGDTVWNDKNNNGTFDQGEGLAGVTVELTQPDGTKVTDVTDADGKYLFPNLPVGDYTVAVLENSLPLDALKGNNTVDPDGAQTGAGDSTSTLILTEGENNLDQDFAYFAPGSIGDTVWHDVNNNGVLDANEALAGITVELTLPDGTKTTKVTDVDGKYLFTGLAVGDYTVEVKENTLPANLQGNNSVDPDALNGNEDSTSALTLGVAEDNLDQDFAYFVPASIGDTVWNDKDNDGVFDESEGLAGVTVELTKPDGTKVTMVTGTNGQYLFENLIPGDYTVAVKENTLPAALQGNNTVDPVGDKDSTSTLTLAGGENNLDQDFAYFAPASIGDTIWHDKNNNGVIDAGEALAGITVELTKPDGTKVTAETDTDGQYLFEGLIAGDYAVEVKENALPATLQGMNTVDPDGGKDSKSTLTLGEGENNLAQDFAYFVPGSIGDTIWNDKDNDGVFDAGEGLENVTVKLTPPADIDLGNGLGVATTVETDEDGRYLFPNLPEADYKVEVVENTLPVILQGKNTVDPDGGNNSTANVSLAEGENNLVQDFAYFAAASIGDTIWSDKDNDGVIDDGEALANVIVQLTPPADIDLGSGVGVAITQTTDTNGKYLFPNLPQGDYTIDVLEDTLPEALRGKNTVDPDGANNGGNNGGNNNQGDSTSNVALEEGENNLDQDFAYFDSASIGDTIWYDKNNNGVVDGGEALANVTVELTLPDGSKVTTVTDTHGQYQFTGLIAGNYTVTVDESTLPEALRGKNFIDPDGAINDKGDSTSAVTLAEGESNQDQDFAYFIPGSIGDAVWNDKNNDGLFDEDEGLSNILVTLTFSDGTTKTETTDENGKYLFSDLPEGQYTVAVTGLPEGLQGKNTVDPDGQNDSTSTLTLGEGEDNLLQDFAYFAPGTIGDTVWNDKDNDGQIDETEGLAGITVTLTKPDGSVLTTVTNESGQYLFEDLPAGEYTVTVDETNLPAGLQGKNTVDPDGAPNGSLNDKGDSTSKVTIGEGGSNLDQDFAYFNPGSIGNTIWNDRNNDGIVDTGEALQGVTVELTLPDGTKRTTTTNENGQYLFDNLPIGDYTVTVVESSLPEALRGNNTVDPNGAPNNKGDSIATLTLGEGEHNVDQNFAYFTPASIGDTVWHDKDEDGVVDAGEALAGVTVELTKPDGSTITTTTDANGQYLFEGLTTGNYTVKVIDSSLPTSLQGKNTRDPDGNKDAVSAITLAEGENNLDQDFAYNFPGSIGSLLWNDKDKDGVFDEGEALGGVTVTLTLPDGTTQTTITDENGSYLFENIQPGDYTVTVDESTLPPALQGKNTVDPDNFMDSISSLTLAPGENNLSQNFAYFAPASIGDTIWEDFDNDGVADEGEGLANIKVTLTLPDGSTISTTTDDNGHYLFNDLAPGTYVVTVDETTLPTDLMGKNTVDPDGNNNSSATLTLTEGDSNLDMDFAYHTKVAIGNLVWIEDDNDGDASTGTISYPPAGTVVTATTADELTYTGVTNAQGSYEILVPKHTTYLLTVDTPADTRATNGSTDISVPADASENNKTHNGAGTLVAVTNEGHQSLDFGFTWLGADVSIIKTVYGDDNLALAHDGGAGCGTPRASDSIIIVDQDKSKDVPVTYCFEVTNTGNSYLSTDSIDVNDITLELAHDQLTVLTHPLPALLAPGQSLNYYYEQVLTTSLNNTATVKAQPTDSHGNPTVEVVTALDPSVAEVILIIDPPSALKTVTPSGDIAMEWQMVWINSSTVTAPGVTVYDEVPEGTTFQALAAGDHVSVDGVYCEARGASTTTSCYFDPPNPGAGFPRGRVIWTGTVASDPAETTEAGADNEVVIRFISVLDSPDLTEQEINNQATSEWDYDNDGNPDTEIVSTAPDGQANTTFDPETVDPQTRDNEPVNNQGNDPANIPTLSEWMLILLSLMLMLVAGRYEYLKAGKTSTGKSTKGRCF